MNLLRTAFAKRLYSEVKDLPIIDYHCHLSPEQIYNDAVFGNIGELWLAGDHYKWRLMRTYGINEALITGTAPMREKFDAFLLALASAVGNPQQAWCAMEAKTYFGITCPLIPENAEIIWNTANEVIAREQLRPTRIFNMMRVEYIATTDDPLSDLRYHKLLREEGRVTPKVTPSFRYDTMVNITNPDFRAYVTELSRAAGVEIKCFDDYLRAVDVRLNHFIKADCRFADFGLEHFPTSIATKEQAANVFTHAWGGDVVTNDEGFLGYMLVYLGRRFADYGIVSQLHMASLRNGNSIMYNKLGADTGFDSSADDFKIRNVQAVLDAIAVGGGNPKTVLYTLNSATYYPLATLAGSFRNVTVGIAWWFLDHERGIKEVLSNVAEVGHLSAMMGMLTDSRSFLSYVRHDYFRRVLCNYISEKTVDGYEDYSIALAKRLCYDNSLAAIQGI